MSLSSRPEHAAGLTRRQLLQGAALTVGTLGLVGGAASEMAQSGDRLQVRDARSGIEITYAGRSLAVLEAIHLSEGNDARFVSATVDGTPRLAQPASGDVHVEVSVAQRSVSLDIEIRAPLEVDPVQFRLRRTLDGDPGTGMVPLTRWIRDPRGGVPFQEPLGYGRRLERDDIEAYEIVSGTQPPSDDAQDVSVPFARADDGRYRLRYVIAVVDADGDPAVAAALQRGGAAVRTRADRPFACVQGDSGSMNIEILTATTRAGARGRLSWTLRDFDGNVVMQRQTQLDLSAPATTKVPTPDLNRGSYTGDAELWIDGTMVASSRLLVSVLAATPVAQGSIFGLAALDADLPVGDGVDRAAWVGLVGLLGFAHLRKPDLTAAEASSIGVQRFGHHQAETSSGTGAATAVDTLAREIRDLATVREELGNELDRGTSLKAGEYVTQWLAPLRQRLAGSSPPIPLTSQGLGTADIGWLDGFVAAGGWEQVDAIGLHTGRGNATADQTDGEWTFLGTLRAVRSWMDATSAARGSSRELRITEAYASTQANRWWSDTLRTAAENVLLQAALAMSEGVAQLSWYQLNDGVWYDWQNADPDDTEYSFGLVTIDGQLKPSALAAATVNEHLGGATFQGWVNLPGNAVRALAFERSGERFHVVWSRADGYELNRDGRDGEWFATPEPWVDVWPTKVPVDLQSAAGSVTVIDCLGRRTTVQAAGGKVTLRLDGAPRIVYGLS